MISTCPVCHYTICQYKSLVTGRTQKRRKTAKMSAAIARARTARIKRFRSR